METHRVASIRPKGKGFEVRLVYEGRAVSKSFSTLEEARRWMVGVEHGFINIKSEPKRKAALQLTLAASLDRYVREEVTHHKGAKQELARIRSLQKTMIAQKTIDEIKPHDIRELRDAESNRGVSGSTVRLKLAIISALFTHARKEWGLDIPNPVRDVKLPKPNAPRCRRLLDGEEQRLVNALSQCRNPTVNVFVQLAIETGARKSELLNIEWKDVDFDKHIVTFKDTKNNETRWVPLTAKAKQLLFDQQQLKTERPLPISTSALDQAWGHAVKRAGLSDLRIHDLRHEAISRWASLVNGDVFRLSLISGHKSLQMLRRYVHLAAAEVIAEGRFRSSLNNNGNV